MLKKVAVLIDGGFLVKKLPQILPPQSITEKDVYSFALGCVNNQTEELFRIYYYHCAPYEETQTHPIAGNAINFGGTSVARNSKQLLESLSAMNYVALRKGRLAFRGWGISQNATMRLQRQATAQHTLASQQTAAASQQPASGSASQQVQTTGTPQPQPLVTANDFSAIFSQKEVDIKIGLDVAWLSSNNIVDKIILVTGDTDFVPAMKFARREGVQVVIIEILSPNSQRNNYLKSSLREHSDDTRSLSYSTGSGTWAIMP